MGSCKNNGWTKLMEKNYHTKNTKGEKKGKINNGNNNNSNNNNISNNNNNNNNNKIIIVIIK